jgi:hypothetical protein
MWEDAILWAVWLCEWTMAWLMPSITLSTVSNLAFDRLWIIRLAQGIKYGTFQHPSSTAHKHSVECVRLKHHLLRLLWIYCTTNRTANPHQIEQVVVWALPHMLVKPDVIHWKPFRRRCHIVLLCSPTHHHHRRSGSFGKCRLGWINHGADYGLMISAGANERGSQRCLALPDQVTWMLQILRVRILKRRLLKLTSLCFVIVYNWSYRRHLPRVAMNYRYN